MIYAGGVFYILVNIIKSVFYTEYIIIFLSSYRDNLNLSLLFRVWLSSSLGNMIARPVGSKNATAGNICAGGFPGSVILNAHSLHIFKAGSLFCPVIQTEMFFCLRFAMI